MAARFQDWFTNVLGVQSVAQFGAQQPSYEHDSATLANVDCGQFIQPAPVTFDSVSLAFVRNNLAVVPDWGGGSVAQSWLNAESPDASLVGCTRRIKEADFIAFDQSFLSIIGPKATMSVAQSFQGHDAQHVHEAPVHLPQTGELIFADTSVEGWLWALDVTSHEARKLRTSPPLPNVNGGTLHASKLYLTTNGGLSPAIYSCTLPTQMGKLNARQNPDSPPETLTCHPVVNSYRLAHLNSPNDLIFTNPSTVPNPKDESNILFTDPPYGYIQSWPGVGPPELPPSVYHFNTSSGLLTPLTSPTEVLMPNGLALSTDKKTLYIADSNSTSGFPISVHESSVRTVYAFDWDEANLSVSNRRIVHFVERGWPDGVRVTKTKGGRELLLVASMGGVDVVDISRKKGAGVLLGKFNVGDDIVFNLERVGKSGIWFLTGKKGVYKVSIEG